MALPLPSEGPPIPGAKWPWLKTPAVDFQETALFKLPTGLAETLKIPAGVPHVEFGRASFASKGWYSVLFKTPFVSPPVLVAAGQYRERWYSPPKYEAVSKKVSIPATYAVGCSVPATFVYGVTVPAVSVPAVPEVVGASVQGVPVRVYTIPRIERPDMRPTARDNFYDGAIAALGSWTFSLKISIWTVGFDFNWIRNAVAAAYSAVGYVTGALLNWMWDNLIGPQVTHIQKTMNDALYFGAGDTNNAQSFLRDEINRCQETFRLSTNNALTTQQTSINDALVSLRDAINASLGQLSQSTNETLVSMRDSINSALGVLQDSVNDALARLGSNTESAINESNVSTASQIEDAVNTAVLKWYETVGMNAGQAITPVLYKNVSETRFEIFAPDGGMVLDYIAIEMIAI